MPYAPQGVTVEPNAQTVVVTITEQGGGTPTVYTDRTAQSTIAMPATITGRTTFYLTDNTTFTVSCKVGGLENANGNGGTAQVDLTGGGFASVGVSVPVETSSVLSGTYVASVLPEKYGAKGDGATDDGPAFSAAIAAAAALVGNVTNVEVTCRAGAVYRIATTIIHKPYVTINLNGATLIGPITGYPYIESGAVPATPDVSDVAGQTGGACFTNDGASTGTTPYPKFRNGILQGFRYGMCSTNLAWAHPVFDGVFFVNCNIGFFAYQGCQEPRFIGTASGGAKAGVTFVAMATAFPAGHPSTGLDNYFCDGVVVDDTGVYRDQSVRNDSFDAWFAAAVLRPAAASVTAAGSNTFTFADQAALVSGHNYYIPGRNPRASYGLQIRLLSTQSTPRSLVVIGNPHNGVITNITGESNFAGGPFPVVLVLMNSAGTLGSTFQNIDATTMTGSSSGAVEVRTTGGPNHAHIGQKLTGGVIGLSQFAVLGPTPPPSHQAFWFFIQPGLPGSTSLLSAGGTNVYFGNSSLNDVGYWDVVVGSGTYDFQIFYQAGNNYGLLTVSIDDGAGNYTSIGTIDAYAASGSSQTVTLTTTLTGPVMRRRMRLQVTSKNAASTGYGFVFSPGFTYRKTA